MKRTFVLEDLDCAGCAAKMEAGIRKLDGVIEARVSFLTQKLVIEADDAIFDAVMQQAARCIKRIEPDCRIRM